MELEKLSLLLKGTIFIIKDITIENVPVYDLIEKIDQNTRKISINNLVISNDGVIDIFIRLGAPNGQPYSVELTGQFTNVDTHSFSISRDYVVTKNGILIIQIEANVFDHEKV